MLRGSNFEGVDISNTNLINANLSRITYSDRSKFPAGYLLPADTTNADVYRRADARLAEICAYLVIAVVILVIALVFTKILSATRLTRLSPNGSPALENSLSHGDLPPSTLVDHTPSMDRTRLISSENSRSGLPVWDSTETNVSISKLREANSLYGRQQYAKAISLYEQLIADDKFDSTPKNNLARLLATCPDQRFRDGRRALELALEAYEQTSRSDWKLMCVISAAYAEQGDFSSAIHWANLARVVPEANAASIDAMMSNLNRKQPCRW
jgi:tetratricopeptide (TPR) repeat protein